MDELGAILRARRLSKHIGKSELPVPIERYIEIAADGRGDIVLRYDNSLSDEESGHTLVVSGKRCIVVNGNHEPERRRFTACHELGHIDLGLPSEHNRDSSQFARRSPNETLCDVFASELLLPGHLVKPRVEDSEIEFPAIEKLAGDFETSFAATGSQYAAMCDRPCAFVLAQRGMVRYASRSKSLREGGGFVRPGVELPTGSLASRLRGSSSVDGPIEVSAAEWFDDWRRSGVLVEDARHFARWDQTLALLWFEDDRMPSASGLDDDDDEDPLLKPLDGVLPWPGKSRRRR